MDTSDATRCIKCGMVSVGEPAQHTADCSLHDPETCATCGMTHEEAEALRTRNWAAFIESEERKRAVA